MSRLLETFVPKRLLLLAATDALLIGGALSATSLAAAYVWPAREGRGATWMPIAIACAVVLACLHCFDLYEVRVATNARESAIRLSQVLGTACVVLALVYYADPAVLLHRDVILAGTLVMGSALLLDRRVFLAVSHSPALGQRTLLLGSGQLASTLARELARRPELGVRTVGYVGANSSLAAGLPRLGELEDLLRAVEATRADRVIVALDPAQLAERLPLEALVELRSRGVRVEGGAEAYESVTAKVALNALSLEWLLTLDRRRSRVNNLVQRVFSVLVAASALLVFLPLMGLISLAVKLDSKGPVIFRQPRIGQGGRTFTLYKFRSMTVGADGAKPCEAGDQRVTRVGRWLRRCRLDELPQLFNIVRGDVVLVGPRPFVPQQESDLVAQIPYYRYRWTVVPGITGWAQIHRGYCSTLEDNVEKLSYDLFYIKHDSIALDLLILLQTFKIMLLGRGAR